MCHSIYIISCRFYSASTVSNLCQIKILKESTLHLHTNGQMSSIEAPREYVNNTIEVAWNRKVLDNHQQHFDNTTRGAPKISHPNQNESMAFSFLLVKCYTCTNKQHLPMLAERTPFFFLRSTWLWQKSLYIKFQPCICGLISLLQKEWQRILLLHLF